MADYTLDLPSVFTFTEADGILPHPVDPLIKRELSCYINEGNLGDEPPKNFMSMQVEARHFINGKLLANETRKCVLRADNTVDITTPQGDKEHDLNYLTYLLVNEQISLKQAFLTVLLLRQADGTLNTKLGY